MMALALPSARWFFVTWIGAAFTTFFVNTAAAAQSVSDTKASDAAACAIMTTDTVKKEAAVETTVGGKTVRIGGIAKGSGMIHPS